MKFFQKALKIIPIEIHCSLHPNFLGNFVESRGFPNVSRFQKIKAIFFDKRGKGQLMLFLYPIRVHKKLWQRMVVGLVTESYIYQSSEKNGATQAAVFFIVEMGQHCHQQYTDINELNYKSEKNDI